MLVYNFEENKGVACLNNFSQITTQKYLKCFDTSLDFICENFIFLQAMTNSLQIFCLTSS